MTKDTLINDRIWFEKHPSAIVRFRRQQKDEFAVLRAQGEEAPKFYPSFIASSDATLTWVAVVDLFQLLQDSSASLSRTHLRLRMRTIPLHHAQQRLQARQELIDAVAKELLEQTLMANSLNYECDAA